MSPPSTRPDSSTASGRRSRHAGQPAVPAICSSRFRRLRRFMIDSPLLATVSLLRGW
jgi:hypothetical protein